jgi:thioredoxin-like negative regulator of GroEL
VAKPIVDGLEREIGDRVQVLRLNVLSPVGRAAASAYAVRAVPTFVLFNADGEMVYYQVGSPDKDAIRQEIDKLERK